MGHLGVFVFSALPLFIDALKGLLSEEKDIKITGFSDNIFSTLNLIEEKKPDILFADDSCIEKSEFIDFINILPEKSIRKRTIIYTGSYNGLYLMELINHGIRAIVHKKSENEKIINSIKMIVSGGAFIDTSISFSISKYKIGNQLPRLNQTERKILKLMFAGMENIEIGNKLCISTKTVGNNKENIKKKYGILSAKELYKEAAKN